MPASTMGYDPKFTGLTLKMPRLPLTVCAPLKSGTGKEIKYIHYSCFLHKSRKLPLLCASNIKGEGYNAPSRGGTEPWQDCEQVLPTYQINNDFYGNDGNLFDRGHIVRRVDTCWGDDETAEEAEKQTFRWINCTPQHKKLNQRGGAWFQLEQHIMENGVKNKLADIVVFSGPVLSNNDSYFEVKRGPLKGKLIQVPTEYWKVIVWKKSDNKLYAVGFIMSQWEFIKSKVKKTPTAAAAPLPDDYFENLKFQNHQTYQVRVSDIEKKTGIKFNWSNVAFPYKAARAQTVKATALKNKYPFAAIYYKLKRLKAAERIEPSKAAALRAVAKEEQPLSPARIRKAVKAGFGPAIKQYKLSNIKL
jgi:endonuclease G